MFTDLLFRIYFDCVPYFLGNGAEEFLVYWGNVEALSPCYVVMPLSSDFGLVCDEDPFPVWP